MITINTALNFAIRQFNSIPQSSPRIEAELLLSRILQKTRSYLIAWPEQQLTPVQTNSYCELCQRRLHGEPIAYILGEWDFWNVNLHITPNVLIPGPETELLVELALIMGNKYHERTTFLPIIVDLGTGSGAIAAAIAQQRPSWQIYATDLSLKALAVANTNFQRLKLSIPTYGGNWYEALPPNLQFTLILSNPPYIAESDLHLLQGDVMREPKLALVSGPDGLNAIRNLCNGAMDWLQTDGAILLEHGYNQGNAVRTLLQKIGMKQVQTWRDLAGHERVTGGIKE